MGSLQTFQEHRPELISLAYRMLGAFPDAEDLVQEAWLRWQGAAEEQVHSPRAWLSATVSRLCLDRLKTAKARRAADAELWLPDPVVTDHPIDRESISLAFLLLLERLTPVERAVFLLRQVFQYSHREIAHALDLSEAAVRQSFHRAQAHLAQNRPRFAPSEEEHARMLSAFAGVLTNGDLSGLERLLAEDATLTADSGGKVRGAARRPLVGAASVARFLVGLVVNAAPDTDGSFEVRRINGWPALIARSHGKVVAVLNIETDGHRIVAIRNMVNPAKLGLPTVN